MIELKGVEPFSSGSFRDCFVHPDDPSRCIKVVHLRSGASRIGRVERLLGRRMVDANLREFREYRRLAANGVSLERYFPRLHGPVATDLGRGLCFDRLVGIDGRPPLALATILQGEGPEDLDAEFVLREVMDFAGFCRRHAILASCDEIGNIGFLREDEGFRLVAYDLKYRVNKELLPLSTLFEGFRRRKVERRFARLFRFIAETPGMPCGT
ncbi:MAG: hypothetical protein CMN87_06345 [Stappia sp.]|uniref:YrbL family protein n=1 Tax=Stappia sp. TaxID=1870903 RepID=UPI000C606DE7|nr:YrbL family protein [Stappia sp.]MAA97976.1 hypothetical protein [Stappia sp.]MBM19610.1 hypothetical protein [Stappia sp.]